MLIILFFLTHLIIVGLVLHAYRKDLIFLNYLLLFMLLTFPFVGAISVGLFNLEKQRQEKEQEHEAEEDFDSRFPWLSDVVDLTKVRPAANHIDAQHIVPFQEALLINNMRVRRELIIDVIFESPDHYVQLLHQARLNEDVEVVHYATTILSELSAKYDSKLQTLKKAILDNPQEKKLKTTYLDFLFGYITSQIAEGYHARTLKEEYVRTAEELLKQKVVDTIEHYAHLAQIYADLKEFDKLEDLLNRMEEAFPKEEATWMAKLESIILRKSGTELTAFLQAIKEKNIYFSRQNRQVLAFWQQEFN